MTDDTETITGCMPATQDRNKAYRRMVKQLSSEAVVTDGNKVENKNQTRRKKYNDDGHYEEKDEDDDDDDDEDYDNVDDDDLDDDNV